MIAIDFQNFSPFVAFLGGPARGVGGVGGQATGRARARCAAGARACLPEDKRVAELAAGKLTLFRAEFESGARDDEAPGRGADGAGTQNEQTR